MKTNEYFTMSNGVRIPTIGFGTWQIPNGEVTYNSVSFALKSGYRHIDTAYAYGNEKSVGNAFRDSGIARNEIFVTSKLPAEIKAYKGALEYFNRTMENLGLDYVDLYLIHAPWPWTRKGADFTKENIQVWKAMEEIYSRGRCHAVGVSNFSVSDLTAIMDNCNIIPMANQIKFYIGYTQEEVTQFCHKNNILVEGYSPLASGAIIGNKKITAIAQKYNTSLPQICIRYVLQRGVLPLPKSTHFKYILQNAEMDFEIAEDDMKFLDSLKDTVRVMQEPKKYLKFLNSLKSTVRVILGPKKINSLKDTIRVMQRPKKSTTQQSTNTGLPQIKKIAKK